MDLEKQKSPFRVKNFGNDRDFETVESLVEGLQEYYRGVSVAVHIRGGKYGMVKPFFVDVRQNGEIHESYADKPYTPVQIEQFREAAR